MSREFGFIKDLKKDVNVCKVGFRVLDLWTVTASNGHQHLELIICDGKGDRAHAITRQADFQRLKSSIEENQTYVLHNCLMFDNDVLFKPVDYPFKLVFGAGTKVTRSDKLTDIPSHEFRFKSFKEIGEGVFKDDVLYEIIGVIHEIGKTTVIGDGKKPCTNIVLRDESGNLVDVTLWDKYSVQLMTFLAERKDRGSVILILTHAQCKLADNGKPNLCNNWSGSKLLINLKHPVVEAFRASLQAQGHRFDQSLCQVSSSSQRVNYDEFSNLSGVKSIAEFRDFDKDTYCITVAKSLKFNPNRYGWYYETCTKCTKASRSGGASYKCSCGEEVEVPLTRYKVVVIMEYRDHKAEFLFWDKECFQILGVAADTLRKTMQQVGEDDPHIYPAVLDKLLKIEFALRVKYQLYYHQASVNAFSRDEIVIKNIKARLHPDEIRPEVQKVNESIVRNNTTLPSDPEKISGPGECSRVIPLPQTVKVENIVSSAECLNSDPTITVGSCGVANCLFAGKCKCHPAKRMKKE